MIDLRLMSKIHLKQAENEQAYGPTKIAAAALIPWRHSFAAWAGF
jgi:hypothetical protein